jgi:DNA-binding transcriptional LysR family regulator
MMMINHCRSSLMSFDARIMTGVGVLAAVTETGSFARAAEALGLTPSGVSRAVARLEARVGARLFDRTPRSVTLTGEGRRFHAQVMPLLAGIEEAATEAAGAAAAVSGKLRVNVDPWFARTVLAPGLPRFLGAHPSLMAGVDVAVRFGPAEGASLIARKLLETRVLTCAAPAYLARRGVPLTPHDLLRHEAILFRDPLTGLPFPWGFSRNGEELGVEVSGRMVTDDPSTAIEACLGGQGIFQSLQLGLDPWLERGELVHILTDWSDETYPLYVYHPSRHLPPAKVRAFLDFVQEIGSSQARNNG